MDKFLQSLIRWAFYALFFLVPLVFYSKSYELFEYNKMMLTYGLTIFIAGAWIGKMVLNKKIIFRRTFLDWPILLYLASHILSTIFSLDVHTSIWGYYSRFHEGLLATISYLILFYALVSNLTKKEVIKSLLFSFVSGVIVSLWGTLEHFGTSISCIFITGQANDDCWIQDVRNRVFATLGQPNWMAAYLDVLILATLGFIFKMIGHQTIIKEKNDRPLIVHDFRSILLASLFFAALLFTKSRSGLLGLLAGFGVFGLGFFITQGKRTVELVKSKSFLVITAIFVLITLFFGLPFDKIDQLTIPNLLAGKKQAAAPAKPATTDGYIDIGISESGDIRKIVWKGAIKIWERYPIFGSGVETFAYAYYKDRPVEHNYVSEWDFLYNKAHNEFLNILATTGTVGFLSYLSILGVYSWWILKQVRHPKAVDHQSLILALYAGYISILVTNFFGFSVVIIGIFFFLIPGFCLLLSLPDAEPIKSELKPQKHPNSGNTSGGQWTAIAIICLIGLFLEWNLLQMWQADEAFAYGKNLDGIQDYSQATPYLLKSVETNGDEPTFQDELSYNEAILTAQIFQEASGSAQEKIARVQPYLNLTTKSSDQAVNSEPNNLSFWKTRTKVFYQLAVIDPQFLSQALAAITKAVDLAPTDPKVRYNYGLILGRSGDVNGAIKAFEDTIALKADYSDAHYALGLYYDQVGQKDKARAQMEYILKHIGADDRAVKWLNDNK